MSSYTGKFNSFSIGFFLEKWIYLIEDKRPFLYD